MKLTLAELKDMVDAMVDLVGEEKAEEVEIRYASQPAWPFEYSVEAGFGGHPNDGVIYLWENEQLGYLPGEIKDQLGW